MSNLPGIPASLPDCVSTTSSRPRLIFPRHRVQQCQRRVSFLMHLTRQDRAFRRVRLKPRVGTGAP
jgi:hypothetical protein